MTTTDSGQRVTSPLAHLDQETIDRLAEEFDAIHDEVYSDLGGDRDRRYIKTVIATQRQLAALGRIVLLNSRSRGRLGRGYRMPRYGQDPREHGDRPQRDARAVGLDERPPYIHSSVWDWDTASTAEAWKHSHNYIHHTFTNIRGKDKDLGYEIMRIDPNQKWHPVYLLQPFYNVLLTAFFEWGRRTARSRSRGDPAW